MVQKLSLTSVRSRFLSVCSNYCVIMLKRAKSLNHSRSGIILTEKVKGDGGTLGLEKCSGCATGQVV